MTGFGQHDVCQQPVDIGFTFEGDIQVLFVILHHQSVLNSVARLLTEVIICAVLAPILPGQLMLLRNPPMSIVDRVTSPKDSTLMSIMKKIWNNRQYELSRMTSS